MSTGKCPFNKSIVEICWCFFLISSKSQNYNISKLLSLELNLGLQCTMNIRFLLWAAKPANRGTKESIAISRCVFDRYSICYVWYVSAYMFALYTNHNIVFPESVWAQGSSKSGGLLYIFTCSHLHRLISSHLHSHLHILEICIW